MNKIDEKIEEILRSYFVDGDKDNDWGTLERKAQLKSLFAEQMGKIIGEDEKPIPYNTTGLTITNTFRFMNQARNNLRYTQRQKLKGLLGKGK